MLEIILFAGIKNKQNISSWNCKGKLDDLIINIYKKLLIAMLYD